MSENPRFLETQELDISTLVGVVNETGALIYSKDTLGRYTYANQLVLELFDLSLEDVLGKTDFDFFDQTSAELIDESDQLVFTSGETVEVEEPCTLRTSSEKQIYLSVKKPLRDNDGTVSGLFAISIDVTKRKSLEITAHEQKEFLDTILNNVDALIFMKDENRYFRYANFKTANLFGVTPDEIVGKKDTEVMPQKIADQLWQLDQKVFDSNRKQSSEEVFPNELGVYKHYLTTKIPFHLDDGTKTAITYSTDVTELYLLKEKLQRQAITDTLTGIYNRRFFNDHCEREFSRCQRNKSTMSILIIDIDFFKSINDRFGHPVGDIVLREVTKIYKSCLRKENILCRIGGEEFAILLADSTRSDAVALAERIRQTQEKRAIVGKWMVAIKPTVSIGVTTSLEEDKSFNSILSRADRALYHAKKNGRNQVKAL